MARMFSENMWRRHANQWSVYTRFLALPLAILAGWSRIWIGWWAALPLVLIIIWLAINPFVFKPIERPSNWIEKGILGERLWLQREDMEARHRDMLRVLVFTGAFGLVTMIAGIAWLELTSAILGMTLVAIAQFWRIARYARIYDHTEAQEFRAASPTQAQQDDIPAQ
ncbi:MAG: DUF6653 family protein [Hyphomonadaceae bacterium]